MDRNIYHPKRKDDFLSRHHLYPLERLKSNNPPKVKHKHLTIKLWRSRHTDWHMLFKNATIDEIIESELYRRDLYSNPHYTKVFNCDRFQAMRILKRFKQIKTRKL